MSELEQQTEEIEALISIYEGDTSFKQVNSSTFQCKVINTKIIRKMKFNIFIIF